MKRDKIKAALFIVFTLIIAISTFDTISRWFFTVGEANMQVSGFTTFRYFTNLSNIFASVTCLLMIPQAVSNFRNNKNVYTRRSFLINEIATVTVTITFLTCVFFLGPVNIIILGPFGVPPLKAYMSLFSGRTMFLHLINPLLAVANTVFLQKCPEIKKKDCLLSIIPVFLYALVYAYEVVIVGLENGGWPDFYHFTFGGKNYMVIFVAIIMFALAALLSKFELNLSRRVDERSSK